MSSSATERSGHGRAALAAFICAAPVVVAGLGNGFLLGLAKSNELLYWVLDVVQWVVLPAICLFVLVRKLKIAWPQFGLEMPTVAGVPRLAAWTLLVAIVYLVVVFPIYSYLWSTLWSIDDLTKVPGSALRDAESLGLVLLLISYRSITAGFVEEVFFRGLLRLAIVGDSATPRALVAFIVMSAAIFGLSHWEQGVTAMAAITIIGAAGSVIYLICGSLWPLVIGHTFADFVVLALRAM